MENNVAFAWHSVVMITSDQVTKQKNNNTHVWPADGSIDPLMEYQALHHISVHKSPILIPTLHHILHVTFYQLNLVFIFIFYSS